MTYDDTHLSIDQLADLDADVLDAADAASARAHLQGCAECRATQELLAGVPAVLASASPVPIPADVTARVVAAIEREQITRVGEADEARLADAARARAHRASAGRRFGARLGAGLLGTAAVLGGGYLVINGMVGSGGDSPESEMSAQDSAAGTSDEAAVPPGPAPSAAESPTSYSAASLTEDVQRLLALNPTTTASRTAPTDTVQGEDGEVGEPGYAATKARACVDATQQRAGSTADPIAVDIGTYDGVPAVVIVLPVVPGTSDSNPAVDVWVVGAASCVDEDSASPQIASRLDVLAHEAVRP